MGDFRGLWCTNGSRKPISSRIIPDNPGAERTTGRTGTMARTGTIVHPPSWLRACARA